MDTRFWGPSGWKMLHMASLILCDDKDSDSTIIKNDKFASFCAFFALLPYILPCKFCRYSLTDYYRELPISSCKTYNDIILWVYKIHNKVNAKLRDQKLPVDPDPTLEEVIEKYRTKPATITDYWDFLFAVAYNHPVDVAKTGTSSPMPNCPTSATNSRSSCIRNKWNVLSVEQRMKYYRLFWKYLPDVVLNRDEIIQWKRGNTLSNFNANSRENMMQWLWKMRCAIEPTFHDPYRSVCRRISTYSSGCGGAKTCRKNGGGGGRGRGGGGGKKTVKNRR